VNGILILGKGTRIEDIDCFDKWAVVKIKGKQNGVRVPYDAISWVSGEWIWEKA